MYQFFREVLFFSELRFMGDIDGGDGDERT